MQLILNIIEQVSQLTDLKNIKKSKTQFLTEKCLSEFMTFQKKAKNVFLEDSELINKKIYEIAE